MRVLYCSNQARSSRADVIYGQNTSSASTTWLHSLISREVMATLCVSITFHGLSSASHRHSVLTDTFVTQGFMYTQELIIFWLPRMLQYRSENL